MKIEDMQFPMDVIWFSPSSELDSEHHYTFTQNSKNPFLVDGEWHPREHNAHDEKTVKVTGTRFVGLYTKNQLLDLIVRGIVRVL